jgi:hypothetical protein
MEFVPGIDQRGKTAQIVVSRDLTPRRIEQEETEETEKK